MEGLAPTLQLCLEVRMLVERGESIYVGINKILPDLQPKLRSEIMRIILQFDQGGEVQLNCLPISAYRRELYRIILAGFAGEPVALRLKEIEIEIQSACELEMDEFLSALPMRAMMPVLLIQFPAFLILMFGPVVQEITRSFAV